MLLESEIINIDLFLFKILIVSLNEKVEHIGVM